MAVLASSAWAGKGAMPLCRYSTLATAQPRRARSQSSGTIWSRFCCMKALPGMNTTRGNRVPSGTRPFTGRKSWSFSSVPSLWA